MADEIPSQLIQRIMAKYGDASLIGERLQRLIESAGEGKPASYQQLADALARRRPPVKMSKQAVYEVSKGKRQVRLEELLGIADEYDVLISDLILSDGAAKEARAWVALERAAAHVRSIEQTWQAYEDDIAIVRRELLDRPAMRASVDEWRTEADERLLQVFEERARITAKSGAPSSFRPSLESNRAPVARAADDALSGAQLAWDLRGGYVHKLNDSPEQSE